MKQLFILFSILTFAALQVEARKLLLPIDQVATIPDSIVRSILYKQLATKYAGKGTETRQRLAGYSGYITSSGALNQFLLADSSKYYYSGNRGSFFPDANANLNASFSDVDSKPDSFFYFVQDQKKLVKTNAISHQYDKADRNIATIYPNGRIEYLYNLNGTLYQLKFYDSYNNPGNQITLKNTETFVYNNSNHLILDSVYDYTTKSPYSKYEYEYNADGQLLQTAYYIWSSSWQNQVRAKYTYDATGNNTFYIIESYNATLSAYSPVERYTMTYNSYNNLTVSIIEDFNGSAWDSVGKSSFTYLGNNPLPASIESYYKAHGTTSWEGTNSCTYHLDNNGRWDSIYLLKWDATNKSWKPNAKAYLLYNDNNLITNAGTYEYNTSTGSYNTKVAALFNYYYEDAVTAVPSVQQSNQSSICIFPNPVKQTLHISIPQELTGQRIKMSFINTLGQSLLTQSESFNTTKDLDLSSFPAGIYWIFFKNESGQLLYKQAIEKLD